MSPFDDLTAGKQSSDPVVWSDETQSFFKKAQESLSTHRCVTLPHPMDQLWIVTDGARRDPGIGATLYVSRDGRILLAGFFSAKLRKDQSKWLPCEIEALAIASAVKSFSAYIIESNHTARVLTDSKPCVQAHERLCRGEFSAIPHVATFLSTVSRYHVSIQHLAGSSNIPSDFASRNAAPCEESGLPGLCIHTRNV